MVCPKCKSEHVVVSAVNEVKEKRKKGFWYWLFVGWWLELILWIFMAIPKLLILIFGKKKKVVSKTVTYATCQDCGYRWKV